MCLMTDDHHQLPTTTSANRELLVPLAARSQCFRVVSSLSSPIDDTENASNDHKDIYNYSKEEDI